MFYYSFETTYKQKRSGLTRTGNIHLDSTAFPKPCDALAYAASKAYELKLNDEDLISVAFAKVEAEAPTMPREEYRLLRAELSTLLSHPAPRYARKDSPELYAYRAAIKAALTILEEHNPDRRERATCLSVSTFTQG